MIEGSTRGGLRRSMKLGAISAVAMALSLSLAPAAHAAQAAWMAEADENAEVLDDGASPEGKTTWGSSVQFSGPGKLTVSAYDLGVANTLMERLDSLSFSVSNSTNLLGSHTGDGTMSFGIDGPGQFFVNFNALVAQDALFKVPLVSWSISFTPNASAVPLPASVWLLLAGFAWATGMQRKRAKLASRDDRDSPRWEAAGAFAH